MLREDFPGFITECNMGQEIADKYCFIISAQNVANQTSSCDLIC
jgi:hypothetical protein